MWLASSCPSSTSRLPASGAFDGSGTWLPLLGERGFAESTLPADVVLDCFGIMHEPDQRAAFARRAAAIGREAEDMSPAHAINQVMDATRAGGATGIVGVYGPNPLAASKAEQQQR